LSYDFSRREGEKEPLGEGGCPLVSGDGRIGSTPKFVLPLINSGPLAAREPNVADPAAGLRGRPVDVVKLPPLGATMDDCCRIAELLLGAAPSGETPLTIAILTIVSQFELSVSVVYTANPLSGDGISIDVEYIPSRILRLRGQG
jgi:hypothetical protein